MKQQSEINYYGVDLVIHYKETKEEYEEGEFTDYRILKITAKDSDIDIKELIHEDTQDELYRLVKD